MDKTLDRLPAGYLCFGDDGMIREVNGTLCAILSRQREELIAKHVESILTVPSRIFYQTHLFPLLKMQGHISEVYVTAKASSGEEVPLLINALRSESDGETINACAIIAMRRRSEYEDEIIKARRVAESAQEEKENALAALQLAQEALVRQQEELKQRNHELERLHDTLAEQVEDRTRELAQAHKELQSFNYSIAHDFRAPLRAVLATSGILLGEELGELTTEQRHLLQRQLYNAGRLSSLVDDLLQFSRLTFKPLIIEEVSLSSIAQDLSESDHVVQGRGDVRFDIESDVTAPTDQELIWIVLSHLLQNAVKFSPSNCVVKFGRTLTAAGEDAYYVRDNGIGIQPQYTSKIFQPFQRLHLDEEFTGNGIGLAIVDRIMARLGGRVWVDSEPGEGATFYFCLDRDQLDRDEVNASKPPLTPLSVN